MARTKDTEWLHTEILRLRELNTPRLEIARSIGKKISYVHSVLRVKAKGVHLTKEAATTNRVTARRAWATQYPPGTTERILELEKQTSPTLSRLEIAVLVGVDINKVQSDIQQYSTHTRTQEQLDAIRKKKGTTKAQLAAEASLKYQQQKAATFARLKESVIAIRLSDPKLHIMDVAEKVNTSRSTVKRILGEAGIIQTESERLLRRGLTPEVCEKIKELRLTTTVEELAENLDLDAGVLIRYLYQNNITVPKEVRRYRSAATYTWSDILLVAQKLEMTVLNPGESSDYIGDSDSKEVSIQCFCGTKTSFGIYDFLYGKNGSCGCLTRVSQARINKDIQELGFETQSNVRSILPDGRELDIYVPSKSLAIEYCGLHFHSDQYKKDPNYHVSKMNDCEKLGIRLITIFSDEWHNRREVVQNYLKAILGVRAETTLGGRDTKAVSVSISDVRNFLDDNHIQGSAGHRAYALYLGKRIVAAMTFRRSSKARRGAPHEGHWELSRYCVASGFSISGGFQKLLRCFIRDRKPEMIVTFADLRWSQGAAYARNGFRRDGDVGINYWYTKTNSDCFRAHKSKFRKSKIVQKLGPLLPGETEAAAMNRFEYNRIWDCGMTRWVWTPPAPP